MMVRSNRRTMQMQQVQVQSHYNVPWALRRAPTADTVSSASPQKYENYYPLLTTQEA